MKNLIRQESRVPTVQFPRQVAPRLSDRGLRPGTRLVPASDRALHGRSALAEERFAGYSAGRS